jgi:flagellar protein FliJ
MTTPALTTLLERAEAERDTVVGAARRAEDLRRRQQQQLQQLEAYRGQHHQRWHAQFAREAGASEIVQCYRDFTLRLDEATAQQQAQVAQAEAQCRRMAVAVAAAELKVASVKKLIERRAAELRLKTDRREQRQSDEFAQRMRWRTTDAAPLLS